MSYRAKLRTRRDDNEPQIISTLRAIGIQVWQLDQPADLLCLKARTFFVVEVKDGSKKPSARKLSENEQRFFDETRGAPRFVVEDVDEALRVAREVSER